MVSPKKSFGPVYLTRYRAYQRFCQGDYRLSSSLKYH